MPFAVPGVIQLTLLDERALLRQIQQLSHDPRYSTILLMRQGAATRSTGQDRPPLIPRDPCDMPSAAASSPQDTSQPRASQDQDRPNRSLLLPEIPVFLGSAVVDYHYSTLGIPSRGHAQMLDRLLAPAQRQFRPVSLSFSQLFHNCTPLVFTTVSNLNYFPFIHWIIQTVLPIIDCNYTLN